MTEKYLTIREVQYLVKKSLKMYSEVFVALQVGDRPMEIVANFMAHEVGLWFLSQQVRERLTGDNLLYPVNDILKYSDLIQDTSQGLVLVVHPYGVSDAYLGGVEREGEIYLEPFNDVFSWGGKDTENSGVLILQASFWDVIPEEEFYEGFRH